MRSTWLILVVVMVVGRCGGTTLHGDPDAIADSTSGEHAEVPDDVVVDPSPDIPDPCTGITGPVLLEPVTTIASVPGVYNYFWPSISWTGSEYAIAWAYNNGLSDSLYIDLYLTRLDPDGRRVVDDRLLSNEAYEEYVNDFVWTGSELGLVWTDGEGVLLSNLDGSGLVSRQTRFPFRGEPALAWSGSTFGVAVRSGSIQVVVDFGDGGITLGSTSPLLTYNPPDLVWTGSEFAVTWYERPDHETRELHFVRLSPSMELVDGDAVLARGGFYDGVRIDWTGSEYGVLWPNSDEVVLMRLNGLGEPVGEIHTIETDSLPSVELGVVWTGSAYGVLSEAADLYLLEPDGESHRDPVAITTDPHAFIHGDLAWSGSDIGVVWSWRWYAGPDASCEGEEGEWVCPMDLNFSLIRICP